jgi:hypothetical protein
MLELHVRRLVRQSAACPAAHVPPAGSRVGAALRPAHAAPDHRGREAGNHAGRSGRLRHAGRSRDADLTVDGAARADATADSADAHTGGAQRGRRRAPARPPLRDRVDRRGHPPAGGCAAGPQGRHPHAWLRERPGAEIVCRGRLRRSHPPERTPGGAGQVVGVDGARSASRSAPQRRRTPNIAASASSSMRTSFAVHHVPVAGSPVTVNVPSA